MEGVPKTAVVKREPSGKWFVVVVREAEDAPAPDLTVSLTDFDLGLSALVTDSNGITVAPACSTRKGAKKLRHEQRKPSRAMSGSKHRAKQRQKVARVYERIAAQRAHHRHKVTSRLVNDPAHKGFVFEDLRITNMLKNPRLAKSISDAAWGDFLRAMACKAERAGKPFVLVGPAQHHAGVLGMRACGPEGARGAPSPLRRRRWLRARTEQGRECGAQYQAARGSTPYSAFHGCCAGVRYPQWAKKPYTSWVPTALSARPIASISASLSRAPIFLRMCLTFEKASSIGLRSGE